MPNTALDTKTLLHDTFSDDQKPGKVIGRISPGGVLRQGIDTEKVIGIDHGALRIQPLLKPGWGRAGVVYGPFNRENGLAFAALVLNGHNTSQTGSLGEYLPWRLLRWAKGTETETIPQHLLHWFRVKNKRRTARQFMRWARTDWNYRKSGVQEIEENMAVGWFNERAPASPVDKGNSFVIHATGAENGEVWLPVAGSPLPAIRGLQNIPVLYIVILREKGAAYYVSSLPGGHGMAAFPHMRPVAIDPSGDAPEMYAGLYQSVLGQIGFRVDTRLHGIQVEKLAQYASWYGTAHAADSMRGSGTLENSQLETGVVWHVSAGQFERSTGGARAVEMDNIAIIDTMQPSGLINLQVELSENDSGEISLIWRMQDPDNYWIFSAGSQSCRLENVVDGTRTEIAASKQRMQPGSTNTMQILDDGIIFSASLNGKLAFDTWFRDARLDDGANVGIRITKPGDALRVHSFEAHPRSVPVPAAIQVGCPQVDMGEQVLAADDFTGPAGALDGKITSLGGKKWRKELGPGTFELTGNGSARVKASVSTPNPGRTAYTLDWDQPTFADVQVEITPPGSQRGAGERGRSGLIFWQDPAHYIAISTWLDDVYDGTSISSFFHLNGFEELYDAVWTNVGRRVAWGVPYTMRVTFDGLTYTIFIDEEPVLQRAITDVYPELSRLAINRIGILANWEWGNDTGSIFRQFTARQKG